jgi:hypothetical protein
MPIILLQKVTFVNEKIKNLAILILDLKKEKKVPGTNVTGSGLNLRKKQKKTKNRLTIHGFFLIILSKT